MKKTDYDAKISGIESKYITTDDYNKFTKDIVDNSIKSKNLVTKADSDAKLTSLNKKINSNKTKHFLLENELKNYKHSIPVTLKAKVILKKMAIKTI